MFEIALILIVLAGILMVAALVMSLPEPDEGAEKWEDERYNREGFGR